MRGAAISSRSASLEDFRVFYAAQLAGAAGAGDGRLAAAFAVIPRESFLPSGPWKVWTRSGVIETPTADPRFLYQDTLVVVDESRGINNGEPKLHAMMIAACDPRPNDTVVHIGCGGGYYTAILAAMIGERGRLEAFEIETDLAERASAMLAAFRNVRVHSRSASTGILPQADVIYVNASSPRPLDPWLDALKPGGRLMMPLGTQKVGFAFLFTRLPGGFSAAAICRAGFIGCSGVIHSADEEKRLEDFFQGDRTGHARSLRRNACLGDESCLVEGDGWWLSSQPVPN